VSLCVRDLHFSRRRAEVLRGVDLTVAPGEMVGLLGPNGAGKSTLVQCILHILKPSQGGVWLWDREAGALTANQRARLLAYVPQSQPPVTGMSVFDFVLLGRRPYLAWRPSLADLARTEEVVGLFGLDELAFAPMDRLSGGQRQKAALARAFAQDTPFLLLDEPTNSLDLKHQLDLMALIRERLAGRAGVLAVLHDLNQTLACCDKVALLHQGRVFAFGPTAEVLTPDNVRAVFGVEVARVKAAGRPFLAALAATPGQAPETILES
jgi:iron complex transport system ATP-binding protein